MHSQKIVCHCEKEMALAGIEEDDTYYKCPDGHKIGYYEAIGREMCRQSQ